MASKVKRVIHIGLFQPEADVVSRMTEEGYQLSEIVRNAIREFGRENFKKERLYAVAQYENLQMKKQKFEKEDAWENMTPENYTRNTLRGKVVGDYACFMTISLNIFKIPLSEIKKETIEDNPIIKKHIDFLDRKLTYINGSLVEEPYYKQMQDKWNTI